MTQSGKPISPLRRRMIEDMILFLWYQAWLIGFFWKSSGS